MLQPASVFAFGISVPIEYFTLIYIKKNKNNYVIFCGFNTYNIRT